MVILTARDEKRGGEAAEKLKGSGLSNVVFHQLDVMDTSSIASLADVLVNNAGVNGVKVFDRDAFMSSLLVVGGSGDGGGSSGGTYDLAEECLKTNYYGTKRVTEALIPLLQLSNSARIINISSSFRSVPNHLKPDNYLVIGIEIGIEISWNRISFSRKRGEMNISNKKAKQVLSDVDNLTEEKVDEVLDEFLRDFKEDSLETNGWPASGSAYKVSKIAINAYTRIMAKRLPNFKINCLSWICQNRYDTEHWGVNC
ncbi:PREDICTED: salutaridine reductase [Nelumbo nucifera]|uniref:Salutaridine reductase n=1 Tax=Nelumbo nucifera TaxID=4432 RepID=A0A1U8Q8U8_NELNU|nr:PREDICTED: salutaridine reductase [Nelumbo nucifera]